MKSFAKVAFALPLMVAAGAAQANPGLHVHPHLTEAPLVDLHPALGLALVVACWAALVWAAEAYVTARRRPLAALTR
ncbi:hypothetical protein [Methylocystis sp. JR02]|uniref:hypothetical protein n=1 Tax=Methylocystis sp. JR02 TaxID=3046284 RepID=UPI0024B8A20A|nr:hypothetical protein [Methylocystis sp. JR02]MDJ0448775.1 hypothetical protein [Methylocystis sp. JR02]